MESASASQSNENKETNPPAGRRFSYTMAEHGEDLSVQNWQKAGKSVPNQPLTDNMGRRFSYKMNDHQEYRSDEEGWVNVDDILPKKAKAQVQHVKDIEESEAIGMEHQECKRDKVIDKKFDELPNEKPWLPVESVIIRENVKDLKEKENLFQEGKIWNEDKAIPHNYDKVETPQAMVSSDKKALQNIPKENESKETKQNIAINRYNEAENETMTQDEQFWKKHKDIPKKFDELPKEQPWVSVKETTIQHSREKETGNQRETGILDEDKAYIVGNTTKVLSSWSIDSEMHFTSNKDRFERRSSLPVTPSKPFGAAYNQPSSNDRRGSLMPTGRVSTTIQSHHMQNTLPAQSSAKSPKRYNTDFISSQEYRKGMQNERHRFQRGMKMESDSAQFYSRGLNQEDRTVFLDKRHLYDTRQEMKNQGPQFYSRIPGQTNPKSQNFRPRDPSPDYD